MMIDDARLAAYLAGDLDAHDRAEVDAALASDPLLAARLARLSHRARLSQTYDPASHEAEPERMFANGAGGRDNIVRLADRRNPAPAPARHLQFKWPTWGGVAASLAVGLTLGYVMARETGGPLAPRADGALMARGDLVQALNDNTSGQPGPIRIGMTFRGPDHTYCRTFQLAAERLSGVACHEGPGWVARMTATAPAILKTADQAPGGAGPMQLSLRGEADAVMVGDALAPADEAQARARGWRN